MQKQNKKKFKTAMLSVLLVGVMVATGIGAYFTATDTKTNVFTVGNVDIELQEPNWENNYPTTPNETVKKDPQIKNIGDQDAYVYMTVDMPYATVVIADADGNKSTSAETELFTYTVNDNWVEVGTAEKVTADSVYRHVYAYVGIDNTTLEALSATTTTSALFEEIKFANVVETPETVVLEGTDLNIVINAYGIEINIIGGEETPEYVWEIITNQVIEAVIVPVTAKDADGNDLNASAKNITGKRADELLASLEASNLATADEVDALIEVKSDNFEGMANTTFDVSKIAKEGDKVVILHYDETAGKWEYITTDTVDGNLTVSGNFSSYSPVAFVVLSDLKPGLYDENDVLLYDWDTLVNTYDIDVEKNYYVEVYDEEYDEYYWDYSEDYNNNNYPGAIFNNHEDLQDGVKLVIGNVSKISESSFDYCELDTIIITDDVKEIDCYAFYASTIENVKLPNSITELKEGVFADCSSLTSISIPESITSIVQYAFYGCTNLSIIVPNNVTTIEENAFFNVNCVCYDGDLDTTYWGAKNLHLYSENAVVIKEPTCTENGIKANVCEVCGKTKNEEIIIVEHIDENGNHLCDVCNAQMPGLYSEDGDMLRTWEELTDLEYAKDISSLDSPILNVDANGVLTTNYDGEANGSNLYLMGKLVISNCVTEIGKEAFTTCRELKGVIIPESVTKIGDYAFVNCVLIKTINIPKSVISISNNAFINTSNILNINVDSKNLVYDSRNNCNAIIETATNTLFIGCKNTVIPSSVTTIGDKAFDGRDNLTSIEIPSSVTSIGNYAFDGCDNLTSITIPDSVTNIGRSAFGDCNNLRTIYIPNSVKIIGESAFEQFYNTLDIYCEVSEEQPEWGNRWNYYGPSKTLDVTYGVTRTEYEALIAK